MTGDSDFVCFDSKAEKNLNSNVPHYSSLPLSASGHLFPLHESLSLTRQQPLLSLGPPEGMLNLGLPVALSSKDSSATGQP